MSGLGGSSGAGSEGGGEGGGGLGGGGKGGGLGSGVRGGGGGFGGGLGGGLGGGGLGLRARTQKFTIDAGTSSSLGGWSPCVHSAKYTGFSPVSAACKTKQPADIPWALVSPRS